VKLVRSAPKKARIEIVPLIDTVFFLLVFFMMSSLSMAIYRGMPVNLPGATTGQAQRTTRTTSITIDREGRTFIERERVELSAIGPRIHSLAQGNPEMAVVINADGDVTHRHVVDVLDALRTSGVSRMAIAVNPTARTFDGHGPSRK
jgi:biopolymer transport protein ExbD